MGVDIKTLLVREKTNLESFSSKIIAIDAYNAIYQFLAIIRGPDGLHLTDTKGRVTSHLTGLLYRNVNFLSMGIKPVYVFDGKPPSLKTAEISVIRHKFVSLHIRNKIPHLLCIDNFPSRSVFGAKMRNFTKKWQKFLP